jgi:hypothetical protein
MDLTGSQGFDFEDTRDEPHEEVRTLNGRRELSANFHYFADGGAIKFLCYFIPLR